MSEVPFQAIKSNDFTGLFHGFSTITVTHLNKSDHHPMILSDTNPHLFFSRHPQWPVCFPRPHHTVFLLLSVSYATTSHNFKIYSWVKFLSALKAEWRVVCVSV